MTSRTTHVVPGEGEWAVRNEGASSRPLGVYPTQRAAIAAASEIVKQARAGQLVVHGRDGSIRVQESHGLPRVQTPPRKSTLGSKAIQRAVSKVIRKRLSGE